VIGWLAPASNGYSISGYTVEEASNQISPISVAGSNTSTTTMTLPAGSSYSFTVSATNTLGTGAASAATPPITPSCSMSIVTASATDSVSVEYGTGTVNADNNLYAFLNSIAGHDITGWMKFDVSVIPSSAIVQSMALTLSPIATNQNGGTPNVEVIYSASTNWSRTSNATPAGIPRSGVVSSTMTAGACCAAESFPIIVSSHNWDLDFTAGTLTLGVTSTGPTGFDQYTGSDPGGPRPRLVLQICN
jgi:hypothetical protein